MDARSPRTAQIQSAAGARTGGRTRWNAELIFPAGLRHYVGPAGVSIACHAVAILLLALATWAVGSAGAPVTTEYHARIVTEPKTVGPAGGYRFPGRAHVDRPDSAQASHETETIQDLAGLLNKEVALKLSGLDSGSSGLDDLTFRELTRGDVLGTGSGGGIGKGGLGSGLGDRDLAGGGPVGSLWGVGEGQRAKSIVYVMDRSGSMGGDPFERLRRELLRAIGSLEDEQLFNVIWFNEGPAQELSKRLLAATIENKRKAFAAIRVIVPSGWTEPVDAVRRGLNYQPDVMFLLSDGAFGEHNRRVIQIIKKKNKDLRTTINTILFVHDAVGDGEEVLRAIAEANNGTFKHVTEEDFRD